MRPLTQASTTPTPFIHFCNLLGLRKNCVTFGLTSFAVRRGLIHCGVSTCDDRDAGGGDAYGTIDGSSGLGGVSVGITGYPMFNIAIVSSCVAAAVMVLVLVVEENVVGSSQRMGGVASKY